MDYRVLELSKGERAAFRIATLAIGGVLGILFYNNIIMGILLGMILWMTEGMYKDSLKERRRSKLLVQFRDMLYSITSSVATGRSLGQAMEESIDFWKGTYDDEDYIIKELKIMVSRMRESNMSDIQVLKDFAERSGLSDAEDLALVCETCKKTGANFPRALEKGTEIISDKITLERELSTIVSQKRFEGRIVGLAPFALVAAIRVLSPAYMEPLYTVPAGKWIATFSLVMICVGYVCMERVNKIEI